MGFAIASTFLLATHCGSNEVFNKDLIGFILIFIHSVMKGSQIHSVFY